MQRYIQALVDYYKQNPPNHGDAESVLDLLCWHYVQFNPIDNRKIRDSFAQLRDQFPHFSLQEFDPIYTTVSDLCVEHERRAFLEGLRLGVVLMRKLSTKEGIQ